MTVIKSEFFLALNQVATERGISPAEVIESIKSAVLAAYKKDYGVPPVITEEGEEPEEENLEVKIDENTGDTKILKEGKDITPAGFGRIAAQTARQVILQKIREAEKKTIVKHYQSQIGTIIKGRVIRFDGKNVYFDIGKAEGILPQEEQIRNEMYRLNDTYTVYILDIVDEEGRSSRIMVSRANPKLVEELFKKEVPEVASGTVKIKNIVREPGERTKIAVFSDQSGVDPVGACVGQKGIRVKSVTDELGGDEKVDIIQFHDDISLYIREALSPATVVSVDIDQEAKHAKVTVDPDQAPLAIGRNGVNVNLASRLTEYEIDIVQTEKPIEEKKEEKEPEEVIEEKSPEEVQTEDVKTEEAQSSEETPEKPENEVETPSEEKPSDDSSTEEPSPEQTSQEENTQEPAEQ